MYRNAILTTGNYRVSLYAAACLIALVSAMTASSASAVTWTGANNNVWQVGDASNWDATFNNGLPVVFDNTGINTNPINIVGTVAPSSVDIQSGTYSFSGGTLRRSYTTAGNISLGFGAGPLGLDGATVHLQRTNTDSASTRQVTFTTPINVTANGGTFNLAADSANSQKRSFVIFSGTTTLDGNITLTGASSSASNFEVGGARFDNVVLNGAGSVNRTINNNMTVAPSRITVSNVTGVDDTLTLTGGGFNMTAANATGSNINIQNLVVNASSLQLNTSANGDADDIFATLRANGGQVSLASGTNLTVDRGTYRLADLSLGGNNSLTLLPSGAQNHIARILTPGSSDVTLSGSGGFSLWNWIQGQNTDVEVRRFSDNSLATVFVQNGGTFRNTARGSNGDAFFHLQLQQGGRFDVADINTSAASAGRLSSGGGGQLRLGDGNLNTQETIRVTGLLNQDNKTGTFVMEHSGAQLVDDGNVVLQYESNAGNPLQIFNLTWARGQFREGSAGTIFAPHAGNLGIAAVGPTSGTVFTATNSVTLTTAGTVGFYNGVVENFSQYSRGALGNVVLQNNLSGIGTLEANTVTMQGGSISPGLTVGTLTIDGDLVLSNTTQLNFELSTPGIAGSGINDLIVVNGDLTLDGVLNVADLSASGTYTLFSYTGTLTSLGLELPEYTTLDLSMPNLVLLNYSAPIPEPNTGLLLLGLGAFILRHRRLGGIAPSQAPA